MIGEKAKTTGSRRLPPRSSSILKSTWYQKCFDWLHCYPIIDSFLFSKWRHFVNFKDGHRKKLKIHDRFPRRTQTVVGLVMAVWYPTMPSSEKKTRKDLHLASSVGELNKLADPGLPVDRNANPVTWVVCLIHLVIIVIALSSCLHELTDLFSVSFYNLVSIHKLEQKIKWEITIEENISWNIEVSNSSSLFRMVPMTLLTTVSSGGMHADQRLSFFHFCVKLRVERLTDYKNFSVWLTCWSQLIFFIHFIPYHFCFCS